MHRTVDTPAAQTTDRERAQPAHLLFRGLVGMSLARRSPLLFPLGRLIAYVVIIPTYLYTLLGPNGLLPTRAGWGAVLLWTAVVGAFALMPTLVRPRLAGQAAQRAYVAGYLALAAWIAWLAHMAAISVFTFYLVLATAITVDRRLGRRVGAACIVIVYLEAYLLFGRSDPTIYVNLLTWVGGLLFTAVSNLLYLGEQEARARSDQLLVELQVAHGQLREYAEQVRELAAAQERSRLAQELHDSVTQTLFSASLIADVLPRLWARRPELAQERLEELRQLARGALAEMRLLLLELRPAALTQVPLSDLLDQLARAAGGQAHLRIEVRAEGQRALPPDVQVTLYRIAQEALNNVVKYANATAVTILLRNDARAVELRVQDDGQGFDPAAVPPGHLGLGIMRERAQSIGAMLHVESAPGRGTTVTATWADEQEGHDGR